MNDLQNHSSEQRNAFFVLKELMEAILVCIYQTPDSFTLTKVERLRVEVSDLNINSVIDNDYWLSVWDDCFFSAKEQFQRDQMLNLQQSELSWQSVFDTDYTNE